MPREEGRTLGKPGKAIVSLENGSPQGEFITAASKPLKLEGRHILSSSTMVWPDNEREAATSYTQKP